jgi:SAM-dependent methyltransferase
MASSLRNKVLRRLRRGLPEASVQGEFDADFYNDAYENEQEYRKPYRTSRYYFVWTVIADRLRRAHSRGVLEIGCGSGQLAQLMRDQKVPNYLGFDFSSAAIALASANSEQTFVVADAKTTDLFTTHEYDTVVCTEVLEHVDFDLDILDRIPAGTRCICSVPSFPYISHVRHFETAEAVTERYESMFDGFDVLELPMPVEESLRYYLFEGIRNTTAPTTRS